MKFDELLKRVREVPFFDITTVAQISGESKESVRVQLHRWVKKGKLISLRRGLYSLTETYRRQPLSPLRVANELYKPSYLSGLWVLSFLGLIPEMVVGYTCISTRVTRSFTNVYGNFLYSHIKPDCFFGFSLHDLQDERIWLSEPEKALLDHWHLHSGEWSVNRMQVLRFQQVALVDCKKLSNYAERFSSPRLFRAVDNWISFIEKQEQE